MGKKENSNECVTDEDRSEHGGEKAAEEGEGGMGLKTNKGKN